MDNGTMPSCFYLTLFRELAPMKPLVLVLALAVYVAILLFNGMILLVVFRERSLHEPMYVLICCLSVNDLCGSSGLFPRLMVDLLSDVNTISRLGCFAQIFVIYTYAISECTVLTLMAYDRYVAICHPLRYHEMMSVRGTVRYVAMASLYALVCMGLIIFFSARLPLCGIHIARLYCSNWSVVRLSCGESTLNNNVIGFFVTTTTIFLPVFYILYTYVRILLICRKSSLEFKGKALQTCLPHIVSFLNYSIATFGDIALSRYDSDRFKIVAIIFSLEFLVIPPVLNPLIYGLNLPEIRKNLFRRFRIIPSLVSE